MPFINCFNKSENFISRMKYNLKCPICQLLYYAEVACFFYFQIFWSNYNLNLCFLTNYVLLLVVFISVPISLIIDFILIRTKTSIELHFWRETITIWYYMKFTIWYYTKRWPSILWYYTKRWPSILWYYTKITKS